MENQFNILLSPLFAAGAGTMMGIGSAAFAPIPNIPPSVYFRSGMSGALFFLGVQTGIRTFYQEGEVGRAFCVTGFGTCIGSSLKIDEGLYCEKRKVLLKPEPWRVVMRSGVGGGLISLGFYGGVRALMLDYFSADR